MPIRNPVTPRFQLQTQINQASTPRSPRASIVNTFASAPMSISTPIDFHFKGSQADFPNTVADSNPGTQPLNTKAAMLHPPKGSSTLGPTNLSMPKQRISIPWKNLMPSQHQFPQIQPNDKLGSVNSTSNALYHSPQNTKDPAFSYSSPQSTIVGTSRKVEKVGQGINKSVFHSEDQEKGQYLQDNAESATKEYRSTMVHNF